MAAGKSSLAFSFRRKGESLMPTRRFHADQTTEALRDELVVAGWRGSRGATTTAGGPGGEGDPLPAVACATSLGGRRGRVDAVRIY